MRGADGRWWPQGKSDRLSIRMTPSVHKLIRAAAAARQTTITDYITSLVERDLMANPALSPQVKG